VGSIDVARKGQRSDARPLAVAALGRVERLDRANHGAQARVALFAGATPRFGSTCRADFRNEMGRRHDP
jgi:hypothetical protein